MTRRERCIGIGCAIGKEMALMLAAAFVLTAIAEGFHWASVLNSMRKDP